MRRIFLVYPIAYSIDRSQAVGDHGWEDNAIPNAITPNAAGEQQDTFMRSVFRSSPDIINLAFSVTSSGATLFTNFDDPLRMAASAFTEEEERISSPPVYYPCTNDEYMIELAYARADKMVDEMAKSKADVLIVAFDDEIFTLLKQHAAKRNKPVETIQKRGDMEVLQRARDRGRFVVGHVDYVGGLEFAGVILVGVDKGRVPPSRRGSNEASLNFLSYASHNRLYVAITRAKYRVEILGIQARGPSELLRSAISSEVLEIAEP